LNIEIIGGGSLGLLLAGRLAAAEGGGSLTLVVRTARQAEAVSRVGIMVQEQDGKPLHTKDAECLDFAAYSSRQHQAGNGADWIILALKQKDFSPQVVEAVRRQASQHTRVCCLQNGMGHLEKLRAVFNGTRLYTAVTTEGAMRVSDTEVRHTGSGSTRIGAADEGELLTRPHAEMLAATLKRAGFRADVSDHIQMDVWDKLIMNCVINPLTALLDIRNGQLLEQPRCLELMRSLYEEAETVAAAAGYGRPEGFRWERLVEVCRATAGNRSSMLQDLSAGRVTELEYLNGSLLREAERYALKLPFHETVYRLVLAKEALQVGGE
jgi:2-dehydropantoate 2-reductase